MAAGAKDQMRKVLEAAEFLAQRFPQLSEVIESIEFQEDYECRIASTNGQQIFFNPKEFIPLSQPDARAIILHEVGHCFIKTIPGIPSDICDETKEIASYAEEMFVNDRLRKHYKILKSDYIFENGLFPETLNLEKNRSYNWYLFKLVERYMKSK